MDDENGFKRSAREFDKYPCSVSTKISSVVIKHIGLPFAKLLHGNMLEQIDEPSCVAATPAAAIGRLYANSPTYAAAGPLIRAIICVQKPFVGIETVSKCRCTKRR